MARQRGFFIHLKAFVLVPEPDDEDDIKRVTDAIEKVRDGDLSELGEETVDVRSLLALPCHREVEDPEPCTLEARLAGCTCTMESVNSASIDPPEPIIDRWCPLHGSKEDPDRLHDEIANGDRDRFATADEDWF